MLKEEKDIQQSSGKVALYQKEEQGFVEKVNKKVGKNNENNSIE